eukprot:TRINITY_DN583_c0_g1_i1.p1 TRINITY_DN583_c0_g1~~TRINITY_DN583_c0_g1_i1.p1  ORF type:complete len:846 (-),score=236.40 TRINITY_DN583_c0_g1_i1:77-2614(-)
MSEEKSTSTDVIPSRPDYGTLGKKIKLSVNLFELTIDPRAEVFLYAIVHPENSPAERREEIKQVVNSLITEFADDFKGVALAHDDARMIYTALPLGFESKEFVVPYRKTEVRLTVQSAASVTLGSLLEFSKGKSSDIPRDAMQALEVILGHYPKATLTSAGRGYFDGKTVFEIADGAEVWLGYRQSVKICQDRVYINVDMANSAFRSPRPILDVMCDIERTDVYQLIERNRGSLPADVINRAGKKLKNLKVEASYMGGKRTWKINGFSRLGAAQHKFVPGEDEKEITVLNYFKTKFKINLQYPNLPLLHVGPPKKNIMLPVELCSVAKGQRLVKLNPRQTADLIKYAAKHPSERLKWIKGAEDVMRDRDTKNSVASQFGISLGRNLAVVDARVLEAPKIQYHADCKESVVVPRGGSWRADNSKFFKGCVIKSWGVLCFERDRFMPDRELAGIMGSLVEQGTRQGLTFPEKRVPITYGGYRNDREIHESIDEIVGLAQRTFKEAPQLLIVVLPANAGSQLYGEIKRYCETEVDVVTQCVVAKKISNRKGQGAYISNVLLKINVKVGGINWVIPKESVKFFLGSPAIIFGADVTHAGPGSPMPSIAAVVASLDATASKYACVLKSQGRRLEIIEDLQAIARSLLVKFYRSTRKKPEKILFYRDGVSEGQFQEVLSAEVKALRAACESLEVGYKPTITFIVVQKRHHVRLFPEAKDADRSGNVPAGTVVDRAITHPSQFAFFLNSHAGLQGTSRPCHYHVLVDENRFTANTLQDFTYKMCYSYARCTKSVSLVPPVYYAHLGAARARFHAKGDLYHDDSVSIGSGASGDVVVEFNAVKEKTDSVMYYV